MQEEEHAQSAFSPFSPIFNPSGTLNLHTPSSTYFLHLTARLSSEERSSGERSEAAKKGEEEEREERSWVKS